MKNFTTDVKMVEIEGGEYKPFFGQDSLQYVEVKSFLIDETLVTNADYLKFLKANPQWTKSKVLRLYADENYLANWKTDFEFPEDVSPNAPVTNVSWYAAKAYAEALGKRLPTVDEWEFLGIANNELPDASELPDFTATILKSYQIGERFKIPVKSNAPNYYQVYDLYGSVWEWISDFNSVMITGESRNNNVKSESLFCAGASLTSTDLKNYAAFIRFAMRGSLEAKYCISNLGFRCAKDLN
nr:formylglycine-generating enzyme family protein [uncultured Flavobacterium sp.]